MTALFAGLIRLGFGLGTFGLSGLAVLAFMGFAHPWLDVLNHLQPFFFCGTLLAGLLAPLVFRAQPVRGLILSVAATGFLSSAMIVVPEAVSRFLPATQTVEGDSRTYKVMSRNLFGSNADMDEVSEAIAAENPDIVLLQEFFYWQVRGLGPLLAERYPYAIRCVGGKRANIALFSRIPFEQLRPDDCPQILDVANRTALIAVRMMPEDGAPFAVVTTHLDWPLPEGRKSAQIAALAEALSTLPDPLVLAGDMNATPWSYGFREFVASSRLTRHTRNLFTYPLLWYYLRAWRPVFPFLPLDHLMTRGEIGISDIKTGDAAGSDHLSIIAELHVPDLAPLTLRPAIMPVSAH